MFKNNLTLNFFMLYLNQFKGLNFMKGDDDMPIDYSKLKGKIKERYGTQAKFAEALGLSERSMSLKLTGKLPFDQKEIDNSLALLDISKNEIGEYFFALKVQ